MKRVKWSKDLLLEIVPKCFSFRETLRQIGLKPCGGNYMTLRKKLVEFGIDFSHFTGMLWTQNKSNSVYRGKLFATLTEHSSLRGDNIKKHLFDLRLRENECEVCGLKEWMGKPITCELHHINGDTTDNRIENLQILCPNCHSQTSNFRNRGKSAYQETDNVEAG